MSSNNDRTLETYNNNIAQYINNSPPNLSDEFRAWFDKRLLGRDTSIKILEIGSGRGIAARYIESKGYKVDRTDASHEFVNFMRLEGEEAVLFNILTDNITTYYDLVMAEAVFLHFTTKELKQVLIKIFNSLSESGQLIFTLKKGLGNTIESQKMNGPRYFQYWQKESITDLLVHLGYDQVVVEEVEDYRSSKLSWLMVSSVKGGKI